MRGRPQPGRHDVSGARRSERADVQVLTEPGVVVPRPPHGGGDVRPAGRMGDLAAGDDTLPLQGRGVLQRVRLRETPLAISRARPVDETRDRAPLCAGRGRGVVRSCASSARSEVGMPLPLRSGRRARNHESRQHECQKDGHAKADRRCRSRRDQVLDRSLNSVILPLTRVTGATLTDRQDDGSAN